MTGVILAGGKSSRMGYDKQLLCVDEERLILHQVKFLSQRCDHILIVSNNLLLKHMTFPVPVQIVKDVIPGLGPIGGVFTAMHYCNGMFYLMACDMPHMSLDYMDYMISQARGMQAVVTRFGDWIEPFHGLYHSDLRGALEGYLKTGRRSIHHFLKQQDVYYIPEATARKYTPNWYLFDNINTREDLRRVAEQ